MYITTMTHFLNEEGNIPKGMTKEGRELASFLALVVDQTTIEISQEIVITDIRCFRKKCEGKIQSEFLKETEKIHWVCTKCKNEGIIDSWQKTQWDNR
jgi:hypothetical protein